MSGSQRKLLSRGLDHGGKGVAKRHGAQARSVFDKFVAVGVPDMGARAAHDHWSHVLGELIDTLRVGVTAAGDDMGKFGVELVRTVKAQ